MTRLCCGACGFEAAAKDFDSVGMDHMCPSCGNVSEVEEADSQ
jgi:rubredoxin